MAFRILLIDDNPNDRALTAREVRMQFPGCDLREIDSDKALTQALREAVFDLVITDYHLPGTNGLKILRRLRQRYPSCPVIIYSGTGNEKVAALALEEGADDYVIKTGGRMPQLIMASRLALDRSQQRQAAAQAENARQETEQEVRRINESLRVVLETAPTPIIAINQKGIVDFVWNRAAEQLLGKSRAEAFGQSIFSLIPEMAPRSKNIPTVLKKPVAFSGREVYYTRADGQTLHLSINASPFLGSDGRPAGMIVVLLDITEQKKAEDSLRLSESRLSLIHDSVSDLLILLEVEGEDLRVILVNRAVCEVLRQPSEVITGRHFDEVVSATLASYAAEKCREAIRTGKRSFFISSTRLPGSRRLTTENTLTPIFDSKGRCTHILLVARDIHARIRSEMEIQRALHALRDSERRYRALAEAAHDLIFIVDRTYRIQYVNSYACSMLRRPAGEIIGQPMQAMFSPFIAKRQAAALQDIFIKGEPLYRESFTTFPGGEIWLGTWFIPMRDSQGNIISLLGVSRDITERMRTELSLRESEAQYRMLVQTSPDAIFLSDNDANITFANQQALEILGVSSQDELLGAHLLDYVVPEEKKLAENHLRLLLQTGSLINVVHTLRRKDGSTVPVEINASLMSDAEGRAKSMVGIVRDISERRGREQALLEGEARFHAIFEKAAIGMMLMDPNRRITESNSALGEILGYSREELVMQSLDSITCEEDRNSDLPSFEQIRKGQLDNYRLEKRLLRKDGGLAWCRLTISAVCGPREELLFLAGMIEDISKQREAEQASRQSSEKLRRYADRLEVLIEIDRAIQQADSAEAIAHETLQRIFGLVPCQRSSLVLFDMEAETATILDARTQHETHLGKGKIIPFSEYGSEIPILLRGELYAVEDLLKKESLSATERTLLSEGFRTIVCIPLITQGELLGALNLASSVPAGFTREHVEIAGEVAGLLAVAIQQARLLDQVRRHSMELESIARLNHDLRLALTRKEMTDILIEHIARVLQCEFVGLLSSDPTTEELFFEKVSKEYAFLEGCRIPPGTDMTGQALSSNQPYRDNNPSDIRDTPYAEVIRKMRAVACVPLITRGHIIGALWIGRTASSGNAVKDISDGDMRLLTSIGDVAASAIHRASLHDQTERRLRRLAALRAVDMAISASIDMRVTLSVILDQVTSQLEVDAGDILILNTQTQSLTYSAGRGFHSLPSQQPYLLLGQGFAGIAALERRVVSIPRLEESQDKYAHSLRTGVEQFTSYFAAPLVAKGQVRGVLELFSRTPIDPDPEWLEYLETMASQAAIAIDNSVLFDDLQRSNTDLIMAYDATIEGWARTLELRDQETLGHTERVTDITVRLARMLGVREAMLVQVRRGALMHDIGKMAIPDSILLKPGPLTPEEWQVMRQHPQYAYNLLSPIAYLRPALEIPYSHHERWDGSGYTRGLKEEEIPLAARVFAVVDVWDALRSNRPYREAWPEEKVLAYLRSESGKQFDPSVVDAFLRILGI